MMEIKNKKAVSAVLLLLILFFSLYAAQSAGRMDGEDAGMQEERETQEAADARQEDVCAKYSIFSWNEEVMADARAAAELLAREDITAIYQTAPEEFTGGRREEFERFMSVMQEEGTEVYYLTGHSEWGLSGGAEAMCGEIQRAAGLNRELKAAEAGEFAGVVLDVEPYLTPDWREASGDERKKLMKKFAKEMEKAYQTSREENLELFLCIPYYYEKYSEEQLERLIADCCDGVLVMNYNRRDEYGQIENEVRLAEKYGKQIYCVSELQQPGRHDLKEGNTYYLEGIAALKQSWRHLRRDFGYDKLGFSYHYYDILQELE